MVQDVNSKTMPNLLSTLTNVVQIFYVITRDQYSKPFRGRTIQNIYDAIASLALGKWLAQRF